MNAGTKPNHDLHPPETTEGRPAGRRKRVVPAYYVVVSNPTDESIRERVSRLHAESLVGYREQKGV